MKMQHLRYFTAVVDHGGVIRAAERLHVTQPTVSAGLKALEEDLGCALFERAGARLRLTPAGVRFHRRSEEILRQCDLARAEVQGTGELPALRLGMLNTLAERMVADLAAALAVQPGRAAVSYRVGTADRVAAWLKQGRIDAALTVHEGEAPAGQVRVLHREPFVCLTAPAHRFAVASAVRVEDLVGEPFVVRAHCEGQRAARARLRAQRVAMTVAAVADSDGAALALVRAGVGVTLAPRSLQGEGLCAVEVADLDLERCLALHWHPAVPAAWVEAIAAAVQPDP